MPSVSVVIPTHGRPILLRRCLAALRHQEYPAERVEIVVVEDGGPGAELVVREIHDSIPGRRSVTWPWSKAAPGRPATLA